MPIKDNNYLVIHGWMITRLDLKGNELLVYALIYSFCQDGKSEFTGSIRYISEWFGWSKDTTQRVLKKLIDRGLIIKTEQEIAHHLKSCSYKIGHTQNEYGIRKMSMGHTQNADGGIRKMRPNNNKYNYKNNNKQKSGFSNFNQRDNDYEYLQNLAITKE